MTLLRSFPALAFGLVLLSIAALCIVQNSVGMLLVAGTVAVISWYITEGPRGRTLPRWVSNILVVVVSLNVIVDLTQNSHDVLGVLGRFAIWLTLIKLYERRTARDHAQLLTLSLLMMMTAALRSNDLIFGILLIVYAAVGLYVLVLFQLYAAFERERRSRQHAIPEGYRLVAPLKPVTGMHADWSFRSFAFAVGAVGILVSLMVFVSFPRDVGAGMIGMARLPNFARAAGFSWNIDLHAGGRINESRDMVMTVKLTDDAGRPIKHTGPLLLRGVVLDHYDREGRWVTRRRFGTESHRLYPAWNGFITVGQPTREDARTFTQHIVLDRRVSGIQPVFSAYAPVAVHTDAPIVYHPATQIVRTGEETHRMTRYTVRANPSAVDAATFSDEPSTRFFTRRSWFSRDDLQTLRDVADSILVRFDVPTEPPEGLDDRWAWHLDVAMALTSELQSPAYTYTTDLSTVVVRRRDVDPIVRFLTESKRGHCEFFASGLAALCYSKSVPARVVAGYIAYNYDETSREYTVLKSNAHAWVEVATGPREWSTFDPTAPTTLVSLHSTSAGFADQMRWAYQRIEGNWSSSVASFNSTAQSQLADSFNRSWTRRFTGALESVRDWMQRVNAFFNVGPGGYIWMGTVALALVIAVIALIKLMRRSFAIRRTLQLHHFRGAEYQRMVRQLGFYLDMLHVLRRAGVPKPDWQPPLQFAEALAERPDLHRGAARGTQPREAAAIVREITDVFYEARYGRQSLDRTTTQRARELVNQLAQRLGVKV